MAVIDILSQGFIGGDPFFVLSHGLDVGPTVAGPKAYVYLRDQTRNPSNPYSLTTDSDLYFQDDVLHAPGIAPSQFIIPAAGTLPESGACKIWTSGTNFVIAFNAGGTIRYASIDFGADGNSWTMTGTTPP